MKTPHTTRLMLIPLLALASAWVPLSAEANTVFGAYEITISESDRFLDALGTQFEDAVAMEEACVNPMIKVGRRNMPAILLENNANSEGEISTFTMEIREDGFVFGDGDDGMTPGTYAFESMFQSAGVTITSSSLSADMKRLTVNFSGLAPGESALFRVDLDPTDPGAFQKPDFRQVLLGLSEDGTTGGVGTVGTTSSVFSMAGMSTPTPDFELPSIDPAPPGPGVPVINTSFDDHNNPDPLIVVDSGGAVPEPSSAALLCGSIALWACRRRG
ncbi:MAG: PEP-CTERM sorting domain-containing protein [Planctomycetota bacterium]